MLTWHPDSPPPGWSSVLAAVLVPGMLALAAKVPAEVLGTDICQVGSKEDSILRISCVGASEVPSTLGFC